MDRNTLLTSFDFGRARLLGTLETIEKSGQDVPRVLAWRPGPGRAHIGWQAMHCAATLDKYLNAQFKGQPPTDPALVANFAGGSAPSDVNVPDLGTIRSTLEAHLAGFRNYIVHLAPGDFDRKLPNGRGVGESIVLLTWHEAHHQGQIHLTWNLYKQAHGIA